MIWGPLYSKRISKILKFSIKIQIEIKYVRVKLYRISNLMDKNFDKD